MATQIGTAYIKVAADTDGLKRDLDKSKGSIASWGKSLGALGAAAGGAALVGKFLKDSVEAAQESEKVQANLERQVESTGQSYEKYQEQIEATITSTSNLAAVDDEELAESFTKLQGSTGDVETALEGMQAAADLAAARNISLGTATKQIEKALSGGTAGLKKYGIQLEKGASDAEVLAALQAKFGGAAETYGNTAAGAQERFGIALENVKEQVGTALLPLLTKFFAFASEALVKFQKYWPQISDGIKTAAKIAQPYLEFLGAVIENVAQQVANIARLIAAIARGDWAAAWKAIKLIVVEAIDTLVTLITKNPVGRAIAAMLGKVRQVLADTVSGITAAATRIGTAIVRAIVAPLAFIGDKVRAAISTYLRFAEAFYKLIGDRAAAIGRRIISGLVGALATIGDSVRNRLMLALRFYDVLEAVTKRAKQIGSAIVHGIWDGIKALGDWLRDQITGWLRGLLGAFGDAGGAIAGRLGFGAAPSAAATSGAPAAAGLAGPAPAAAGIGGGGLAGPRRIARLPTGIAAAAVPGAPQGPTTVVVNQHFQAPTTDRHREARYALNATRAVFDG